MAVSIGSGLQATDDPLSNDLRVSMDKAVGNKDKDIAQLSTMLMKMDPQFATAAKEEWMLDVFIPTVTALSASAASGDTNFAVTTNEGSYARAGDIVLVVQTGEHVRISTAAASAWTVVRAIGSVAAATAASGASLGGLLIVNSQAEEGATRPSALVTIKTADYNYTQIIRDPIRVTGTEDWVAYYSGNQFNYQVDKVGTEHKRKIEQGLFFGVRSYTASGGNGYPMRSFGGLDSFISTNITSVGGALDKGAFADFLRGGMEYGDRQRKVLFAAPLVAQVLSEFLQDNWVHARPEDNIWGVKVDAVISGSFVGGKIPVFVKGDWKRAGEGTGRHIGSRAYLVDMSQLELLKARADHNGPRYLSLLDKRQSPDADEISSEWFSEVTLKVKNEMAHAVLRGVSG